MDTKKIVNICLILGGILLYLVAAQAIELIFELFKWNTYNFTSSTATTFGVPQIIALVIAVGAFFFVSTNKTVSGFLVESANELLKVTYPTPKESGQSAVIAIIMVALATLILTIFDSVWSFITKLVLTS